MARGETKLRHVTRACGVESLARWCASLMHVMMQLKSQHASLYWEASVVKAITLRNLPPELAAAIEQEAERTRSSLNATVIRLLQEAMLPKKPTGGDLPRFLDLDHLAGTWTKDEADEFDRYLEQSRRIDQELTRLEWQREDAEK